MHVTHFTVDTLDHVIIHEEVRDNTELGRLWAGWSLELGSRPEKTFSQRDGQVHSAGMT